MRFFLKTYFTIVVLFCISCNSTNTILTKECPKFLKNDFNNVVLVEQMGNVTNDLNFFIEARYTCVNNTRYLAKGMFDTFGIWNKSINKSGKEYLIWEKVQLFSQEKNHFQVVTSGAKLKTKVYTSVSVFNQDGEDLLNANSPIKEQLITFFGELIKNNNDSQIEFYNH